MCVKSQHIVGAQKMLLRCLSLAASAEMAAELTRHNVPCCWVLSPAEELQHRHGLAEAAPGRLARGRAGRVVTAQAEGSRHQRAGVGSTRSGTTETAAVGAQEGGAPRWLLGGNRPAVHLPAPAAGVRDTAWSTQNRRPRGEVCPGAHQVCALRMPPSGKQGCP